MEHSFQQQNNRVSFERGIQLNILYVSETCMQAWLKWQTQNQDGLTTYNVLHFDNDSCIKLTVNVRIVSLFKAFSIPLRNSQ